MSGKESRFFMSSTITMKPQQERKLGRLCSRMNAERSLLHIPGVLGMELKAPNFQQGPMTAESPSKGI